MNVAVQYRSGHNLVMNLDKLTKKTGIKKAFLAELMGYSFPQALSTAERGGFSEEKTIALHAALKRIRDEIDKELAKTEKQLQRAA